jgi:hypothetical protein
LRSRSFIHRVANPVIEVEGEVLGEGIVGFIGDESFCDISINALVLPKNIEDIERKFCCIVFEKLVSDRAIPDSVRLIEGFAKSIKRCKSNIRPQDKAIPEDEISPPCDSILPVVILSDSPSSVSGKIVTWGVSEVEVNVFADIGNEGNSDAIPVVGVSVVQPVDDSGCL